MPKGVVPKYQLKEMQKRFRARLDSNVDRDKADAKPSHEFVCKGCDLIHPSSLAKGVPEGWEGWGRDCAIKAMRKLEKEADEMWQEAERLRAPEHDEELMKAVLEFDLAQVEMRIAAELMKV